MPRNVKLDDVPLVTEWVTSTDLAEILGVSRQTINKQINQRKFKTLHLLGRTYVVKREEVEALLAEKAKETPAE